MIENEPSMAPAGDACMAVRDSNGNTLVLKTCFLKKA
jgi:hypothetical protein